MKDEPKKKEYAWVRYIHSRIKNNKNFLATITGPTGSGKSWSALSIAEKLDDEFTAERVIFRMKDLMKLINGGQLKKGSVIIWDEAGIDLSNRNWQSATNRIINALLQTFRHKNFILLFTVPYTDFIDASSKKLFHADFETQNIDKGKKVVSVKPKLLQYNASMKKWYAKYLMRSADGNMVKVRRWEINKPSQELISTYEEKKNEFTKILNLSLDKEIKDLEPEEQKEGIEVTCPRPECGNSWVYHGDKNYIGCPACRNKFKNPKMVIFKSTTISATELNLSSKELAQPTIAMVASK